MVNGLTSSNQSWTRKQTILPIEFSIESINVFVKHLRQEVFDTVKYNVLTNTEMHNF